MIGDSAGFAPQPLPTESEQPGGTSVGGEVGIGVVQGVGDVLLYAGKTLALNALTLFAYSTYELGSSIWAGYKEGGGPWGQ